MLYINIVTTLFDMQWYYAFWLTVYCTSIWNIWNTSSYVVAYFNISWFELFLCLLGPPDAPLDVQLEQGPSPGIAQISWLPVTIDAAGTSNGVRVTGYTIYADKKKVNDKYA